MAAALNDSLGISPHPTAGLSAAALLLPVTGAAALLSITRADLSDPAGCALTLINAGYPAAIVGRMLDTAIGLAK